MSMMREEKNGKTRLIFKETLSIYDAVNLRHELLKCLEAEGPVELDLSDVRDCDSAGLQLIFAAAKSAERRQKVFRVIEASHAVMNTLKDAGLERNEIFEETPAA